MERMILSLKNVYMLLMTEDFPIYSESVISKADRKGQTLLRFWQRMVAEEFRCLPYGKMIWRDDDKRNRNTSYICNRSAELRCYQEYAREIASKVSTSALLGQIGRFMEFLSARKYRQDVLIRRVQELMRLTESEDPRVCWEIARQIEAAVQSPPREEGRQGELFQAGYLLTMLTLYAAAGEAMDDTPMAVLRGERYSLEALWRAYSQGRERKAPVEFMTVRSSLIQDSLLPRERFFGREEELYDLREMVEARRKCVIWGIGGIGKTELLRQLLRWCEEEGAADRIAVIPYSNNLIESFARAFPGFRRQEPEEEFHRVLYQMEQSAGQGSRILLLIDNVTREGKEDSGLTRLRDLPCGIIMTTRQHGLEGFEGYRLEPPTASAGMLIFRDNYGRPLTGKDREELTDMLEDGELCHPATLRLMARAAGSKGWSVGELKRQLEKKGISLSWQEGDMTVRLGQMYRQLYSYMGIPKERQSLAELFTLLPRDSYTGAFLQEAFPEVVGKACQGGQFIEDTLEQALEELVRGGWLEDDGSGYSMHPFIAQCLRRKVLTEERLEPVLGHLRNRMLQEDVIGHPADYSEEFQRLCHVFVSVCRLLSGSVSREMVLAMLTALYSMFPTRQETEEYERWLRQLMGRCPEKDDQVEVLFYTVLGRFQLGSSMQFELVYRRQKERLTVPWLLFLDFCIHVGGALIFRKEFALAGQMLQEALGEEAAPLQKATAYHQLSILCEAQGNWEGRIQWSQAGMEYVTAHPECGEYITFLNLSMCCSMYVVLGKKEAAELLIERLQSLPREDSPYTLKDTYEDLAGVYELTFGGMEQALEHYSRNLELRLAYLGKNIEYFTTLGQIAIVLQRLKRYKEAISAYGELLDYAQESGDAYMLQRFSNNLAVLYLDMRNPEEALVHLQTAREKGKDLGGIPMGEALRNTARAYGQLGDLAREHRYYQEAAPLLEAGYGPEHPRTVETKARLEELEKSGIPERENGE